MRKTKPNRIEANKIKILELVESTGRWWDHAAAEAATTPSYLHRVYQADLDRLLKTFKR